MWDRHQMEQDVLATGRVDSCELEVLRQRVYDGGMVARPEADFLVSLHKHAEYRTPTFDQFFYQAIKDHLLTTGRIDAEAASWLRQMILADGKVDEEERKLLHELRGEAKQVSQGFETLFEECMQHPPEQHTRGLPE